MKEFLNLHPRRTLDLNLLRSSTLITFVKVLIPSITPVQESCSLKTGSLQIDNTFDGDYEEQEDIPEAYTFSERTGSEIEGTGQTFKQISKFCDFRSLLEGDDNTESFN